MPVHNKIGAITNRIIQPYLLLYIYPSMDIHDASVVSINAHKGTKVLSVGLDGNELVAWLEVPIGTPAESYTFYLIPTYSYVPDEKIKYLGPVVLENLLTLHVYLKL
jgi:hypothetical protein